MKKYITGVIILLGFFFVDLSQSQAQSRDKKTWLSGYFGHQEYKGDIGDELLTFNVGDDWAGGIGISQYLNRYLDLEISVIYGELDFINYDDVDIPDRRRTSFENSFLNFNGLLKFKPLQRFQPVQPFIATGMSLTPFFNGGHSYPREPETIESRTSFQIPFQLGTDIRIADQVYATLNATYNRTFSDGIDGRGGNFGIGDSEHDDFMVYTLGIKISISQSKDTDGDGVLNSSDSCPDQYGESFWGCPDQDGDTVIDSEDKCPTIPGRVGLSGCPDSDRDGLSDQVDECPKAAGPPNNKGCPTEEDSDGDGLNNQVDECPQQAGSKNNNGCPTDSDGDSIVDNEDKCPNEVGPPSNNGCPEAKELDQSIKKELETITNNIQFSSNSSDLNSSTQNQLDRLAEIMNDDTDLRLIIRAHTDDIGEANANLELSIARANAVKQYLQSQGVAANRIYAFGYGETQPVASNETEEGRRQNRRVELELYYNQ